MINKPSKLYHNTHIKPGFKEETYIYSNNLEFSIAFGSGPSDMMLFVSPQDMLKLIEAMITTGASRQISCMVEQRIVKGTHTPYSLGI